MAMPATSAPKALGVLERACRRGRLTAAAPAAEAAALPSESSGQAAPVSDVIPGTRPAKRRRLSVKTKPSPDAEDID